MESIAFDYHRNTADFIICTRLLTLLYAGKMLLQLASYSYSHMASLAS